MAEYYSPNGRCCINTQTAALLTLHEGLNRQDRALQQLLTLLQNADDKLKTGFVGTPLLCEELADHRQEKLADKLLLNEEYPGCGLPALRTEVVFRRNLSLAYRLHSVF